MTTTCLDAATHLSDGQLLVEVKAAAGREREATTRLIALLAELDARRLYLGEGYSSLFTYCTHVLRLSEHAAYGRIAAARAARTFPAILDRLTDGSLTLTAVTLLAPHLTPENHLEVLAAARHQSKRAVEAIVARLRPQPAVPATIRKLPAPVEIAQRLQAADVGHAEETPLMLAPPPPAPRPALVTPLAPERYKVQVTLSRATHDKLRRAQDLLRHAIPTGDLAVLLDRALTLLLSRPREGPARRGRAATADAGAHRGLATHPGGRQADRLGARRRAVRVRRRRGPMPGTCLPGVPPHPTTCARRRGRRGEHRSPLSGA